MDFIVYRDTELVVCRKPAGVLSEGASDDPKAMPGKLAVTLAESGAPVRAVYPVHRLDRETEGLMVYALTEQAAASLSRAVADKKMEKQYIAHVHGMPEPAEGEMRDLLYYDRSRNKSFPVKRERKGVKEARLTYTLLSHDSETNVSTVRVRLLTGRTHQIRVQFASRGMPLLGDRKYGAPAADQTTLALRSVYLSFPHPKTGKTMTFED